MSNQLATGIVFKIKDKKLQQATITKQQFIKRLTMIKRTPETQAEFLQMSHEHQLKIKDVGAWFGGTTEGDSRAKDKVLNRCLVALDMDYGVPGILDKLKEHHQFECVIHSTHKHTPEHPRLRLVFFLKEPIAPELYAPLCQALMRQFGIQYFDTSCDQVNRLMFWGSASKDGEIVSLYLHGPELDAQDYLKTHALPSVQALTLTKAAASVQAAATTSVQVNQAASVQASTSATPVCASTNNAVAVPTPQQETSVQQKVKAKLLQADPYKKTGIIGAFIRSHTPEQALKEFASGLYRPTSFPNRYDYITGEGANGLVIYENAFLYSYHNTDPLHGKLYNVFDFVLALKFGKGKEAFNKMLNFCYNDPTTMAQYRLENPQAAVTSTSDAVENKVVTAPDNSWQLALTRNKDNSLKASIANICLILRHDPKLQGIALNEYTRSIIKRQALPWHNNSEEFQENDFAACRCYFSEYYNMECPESRLDAAIRTVASERAFHPLKERLQALPAWDGLDHITAIFVDYLGAENCAYTRAVARCFVLGLLKRILHPGCKHDTMTVLVGEQGENKSKFWDSWFPDYCTEDFSFDSLDRGKEAAEKLQQNCIVHVGELCGMTHPRTKYIKNFLSLKHDLYRAAYGKKSYKYLRQCVFTGSTNEMHGFLFDTTGNRRFHPLPIDGTKATKNVDDIAPDIELALAQGLYLLEQGALSYLSKDEEALAKAMQARYMVKDDDLLDLVTNYTNILWPSSYKTMTLLERQDYVSRHLGGNYDDMQGQALALRNDFCNHALFQELIEPYCGANHKYKSNDIANAMQQLKIFAHQRRSVPHYGQMRCYCRISA